MTDGGGRMAKSRKNALQSSGYVIISSNLSLCQLEGLRKACEHVKSLALAGKWPHTRTLPKQFPPWTSDVSNGIWGVQHLMHPDLPFHDLFVATYFSDLVIETVKELLSCSEEELVMELYNLLVTPTHDFSLRWHRDDIPPSATPEEELAKLSQPAWHAQWNLALYDDTSLIVVPGSHNRARTDVERAVDSYRSDMPGQISVHLKAGDVVFYDNNILHRGIYDSSVPRMTLHGSIGHVNAGNARARNVLQHGVGDWVDRCNFSSLQAKEVHKRAESMREKLLALGRVAEHVGFAHGD